jgi:hypothetical protein
MRGLFVGLFAPFGQWERIYTPLTPVDIQRYTMLYNTIARRSLNSCWNFVLMLNEGPKMALVLWIWQPKSGREATVNVFEKHGFVVEHLTSNMIREKSIMLTPTQCCPFFRLNFIPYGIQMNTRFQD